MKMIWKTAMIAVLALALIASSAMAMPIRSNGNAITLTGTKVSNGERVKINLDAIQLLGLDENGNYLVFGNNTFYAFDAGEMAGLLAQIDPNLISGLPNSTNLNELSRGDRGDGVATLQRALIDTGFLSGSADGAFGPGTEGAVKAFQIAQGLNETGVADARLQMLAISMSRPGLEIGAAAETAASDSAPMPTPDQLADDNLQMLIDNGLVVQYDDITGIGFISDGQPLTFDASGASDIDYYHLSLQFGFYMREDENGNMDIQPAVQVSCRCVRRPVLAQVIVKSGKNRGTSDIIDLEMALDGSYAVETGVAILNNKMVNALANAAETGDLKVRVKGRYNAFDVAADAASLASAARIGALAQSLKG